MIDFTKIIYHVADTLWYLIPVFIIAVVLRTSWFKGVVGEFIVNLSAKLRLNKDEYHLLKNITLRTEDGTTQIDHIIVSIYGVFVIETKNMKGWIFGRANQRTWIQQIYKYKTKFQNPLHQNYKHVKTLQSLLSLNERQVYSIVVFVGDSTFKTEMPANVTYAAGYIRYIKSKKETVLSPLEVSEIISQIESGRLTRSFKTQRDHVQHVKNIVREKQNNIFCPKCGSDMVMREAKKGPNTGNKFWGCSKFPHCRGIASV